jgi:hypothetical protein
VATSIVSDRGLFGKQTSVEIICSAFPLLIQSLL